MAVQGVPIGAGGSRAGEVRAYAVRRLCEEHTATECGEMSLV